jgi:hypothetical protein
MSDLMASGTNPGSTYTITAGNPGVYHEDRVVVTTVGGVSTTQMFRVYGAAFDPNFGHWSYVGATTAYAMVQNPDGSIHYFTYSGSAPWHITDWQGANNNTVYNAVDFAANGGANPSDITSALTSTFNAIFNTTPVGGMLWIPEFGYQVDSVSQSGSPLLVPYCAIIQGLGTGGENQGGANGAFHFNINGTGSGANGNTLFYLSGAHNSGGTKFKNLGFRWLSSGTANDQCINVNNGWAVVAEGCFFRDCPIAFNSDALASGLLNSAINYTAGSPNNAVAVILQAPQTFAFGPGEYAQDAVVPDQNSGKNPGPTNCVGVMICGGPLFGEHCQVFGLHLSDWSYGVCFNTSNPWPGSGFANFATATMNLTNPGTPLSTGSQDALIHNIECQAYVTAIYIQPASSSGNIYGVKVSDSYLVKTHNSQDDGGSLGVPGAIVYIDTNGGANSNVSDIELVNCTIFSDVSSASPHQGIRHNNQYGVNISTGDNIRIISGRISNCGTTGSPTADGTANIAITGAVGMVTIDAVNLSAQAAQASQQRPSQWGLLVSGNINGPVNVTNCNFGTSGWGASGPVSVTGTTSANNPLYITNCPGYNDQNTVINTLAHISANTAYSAHNQGSNSGTSYYGPSFVMFTASATGVSTFQYNGGTAQTLVPKQVVCLTVASPYDTIQFNGNAPSAFSWIGK